jgi:recombination protein RecA
MTKKKKEKPEEKDSERKKVLKKTISSIEKKFGEGSIMRLKDTRAVDVDAVSTGSIGLDLALGIGGIPKGRIVEIYGGEMSGKTTLSLHILAEAQKRGGIGAFIDAEHALDPDYARRIGVNVDDLLISQPNSGEQALQITETLVESGKIDVIVVDSVAALTPKAEIAGEMGDFQVGLQARLMSQALRKLTGMISKTETSVIFINQTRMKIGVFYGNPKTTSGGVALKFYSSVRINLRRAAQIKSKDKIIGNRIKAKVVKNKVAAPFKTVEFDIYYNEGISHAGDILNVALAKNLIKRSGSWYSYNKKKLGQGKPNARDFLKENPKLMKEIKKAILESKEE